MSAEASIVASRRLGLGARQGELAHISSDPRGYVQSAIRDRSAAILAQDGLGTSSEIFQTYRRSYLTLRKVQRGETESKPSGISGKELPPSLVAHRQLMQSFYRSEVNARLGRALSTERPFVERLVQFWSNHFCISIQKNPVRCIAGAYEREVIRPHVLGNFYEMLLAAIQHPAMLIFLDNARSYGPNSPGGRRLGRGLNENLAREILELHTIGVKGLFDQEDVTNLARILTGWSVARSTRGRRKAGRFWFRRSMHEPGDWAVLGRRYTASGTEAGEQVLRELAHHPATAKMVAHKFASYFLTDRPPPELVAKLVKTFVDTGGDLQAMTKEFIAAEVVWSMPPKKVMPPYDFLIAIMRGLELSASVLRPISMLRRFGQPVWRPPSPKGWPDGDHVWAGPSAMVERLRLAGKVASIMSRDRDPVETATSILGAGLSSYSKQAIARAQDRKQGFELLIMSPAFQRR